jgi:hypothetical protein
MNSASYKRSEKRVNRIVLWPVWPPRTIKCNNNNNNNITVLFVKTRIAGETPVGWLRHRCSALHPVLHVVLEPKYRCRQPVNTTVLRAHFLAGLGNLVPGPVSRLGPSCAHTACQACRLYVVAGHQISPVWLDRCNNCSSCPRTSKRFGGPSPSSLPGWIDLSLAGWNDVISMCYQQHM